MSYFRHSCEIGHIQNVPSLVILVSDTVELNTDYESTYFTVQWSLCMIWVPFSPVMTLNLADMTVDSIYLLISTSV